MKFKVFNYGAGNLYSIRIALEKEGVASSLTRTGAGISESDALVLPGVGSFDQAAKALPLEQIREIIRSGKPVMGICLGLQLFYSASEEGSATGLSLLRGRVRRFPSSVKVPQIGWNTLKVRGRSELTDGVPDGSWVYFVNSFVPEATGGQVAATSRLRDRVSGPGVPEEHLRRPVPSGEVRRRRPQGAAELHQGGEKVTTWSFGRPST